MGEVVYTSRVEVVRDEGPRRTAWLPGRADPVTFGVHGAVAEHYGVAEGDVVPDATTIDYLVAAAGGWLTGTFGGALEARGIPAGGGRLRADITGDVELDGKTLVLKRVHATYTLSVSENVDRERIERTHGFHADRCPVARSIRDAIEVTTSYTLVDE